MGGPWEVQSFISIWKFWYGWGYFSEHVSGIFDLSIGSTETKYIKLNTKTQNIFCCVNKNLTTFLYTLTGGQENRRRNNTYYIIILAMHY